MASLAPIPLDFTGIALSYNTKLAALQLYYSADNPNFISLFGTFTKQEIRAELDQQLAEAEHDSCLALLAALEAVFQLDFKRRVASKGNDEPAKEFKRLAIYYGKRSKRVPFDERILETWKQSGLIGGSLISEIRTAFRYRHWLAHGRYWQQTMGRNYDFYALTTITDQVQQLPLLR